MPSGFYPYPFEKPVSPLVYINQLYRGHPLVYPLVSQSIQNHDFHSQQQPKPHSNQAHTLYNLSPEQPHYNILASMHSPQYDHPPPLPPRDTPYHQSYLYENADHHFKPTAFRASFRYPKSNYAGKTISLDS